MNLRFPAFWGRVGRRSPRGGINVAAQEFRGNSIWNFEERNVLLCVRDENRNLCCWHRLDARRNEPAVFVWGHPFVASDSDFNKGTAVKQGSLAGLPDHICRLYERRGTHAFALLEGNFSLLLSDPRTESVFLVVDKYGCDDVFVREEEGELRFASHPAFLLEDRIKFDPCSIAFLLAQEGFVPAPFTLWEGIQTIGRARFLHMAADGDHVRVSSERYWRPSRSWELSSKKIAIEELFPLLVRATKTRTTARRGLLFSGGTDSALLANILAGASEGETVAITGTVEGYAEGEQEIASARTLARILNLAHETVVLNPLSETLPEEWSLCTQSWAGGTRVILPLFLRFGRLLRERLGDGYSAFTGQMADTLADNNYTLLSPGYRLRRLFYSAAFRRVLPFLQKLAPSNRSAIGKSMVRAVRAMGGFRAGGMLETFLDGLASEARFYEGRLFGFGEMPGRSPKYFPALTDQGFQRAVDWYSAHFIQPIVSEMEPKTFYRDMIELSMDMVMLHLDTRLVFHVFRLTQCSAAIPFLDSRVVNFFASLPDSARAFYLKPKHMIRAQFERRNLVRAENARPRENRKNRLEAKSLEQLLLKGVLGAYFRELLSAPTAIERVPALFEYVDESYLFHQLRLFGRGASGVDCKYISRLAALELWSRAFTEKVHACCERASA